LVSLRPWGGRHEEGHGSCAADPRTVRVFPFDGGEAEVNLPDAPGEAIQCQLLLTEAGLFDPIQRKGKVVVAYAQNSLFPPNGVWSRERHPD